MALSGFERRWLLLVFDTVVPSGADERMSIGARDVPMGDFIDDLWRRTPLQFRLGLRACLWFVMLCPLLLMGRVATFAGLTASERTRLLTLLGASHVYLVREMPLLFKTVACLGLCGLPDVQRKVGITLVDATPPEWARAGATEGEP